MGTFEPVNTVLLVVITIVLTWYLRDRFRAMEKRFDSQDARFEKIDVELASMKASVAALEGRFDELSREIVGMRSDQVQIALAVGARARPEPA